MRSLIIIALICIVALVAAENEYSSWTKETKGKCQAAHVELCKKTETNVQQKINASKAKELKLKESKAELETARVTLEAKLEILKNSLH